MRERKDHARPDMKVHVLQHQVGVYALGQGRSCVDIGGISP